MQAEQDRRGFAQRAPRRTGDNQHRSPVVLRYTNMRALKGQMLTRLRMRLVGIIAAQPQQTNRPIHRENAGIPVLSGKHSVNRSVFLSAGGAEDTAKDSGPCDARRRHCWG